MPGAFQSVATATSIVARCPGRSAACAGPARASASDAAAIRRTRRLCRLQELLAVDERAAREPRPARQLADLDVHRIRLATVLAADAELDVGLRRAPALDADPHQVADAVQVEGLERVLLEHAVLEIEGQELPLGVVA